MANVSSNWQDALNQELVNRLTRPLRQPGMMKMGMSKRIINRCDRFLNRLPLLSQQMQRWGNTKTLSYDDVPIVYAQPILSAKEQGIETRENNSQLIVSHNQPSVPPIQRKVDSSQSLAIQPVNNTIVSENKTYLSNSNASDEITPSLVLETHINQTYISPSESTSELNINTPSPTTEEDIININQTSSSSSENLVVSPQPISEEISQTTEMPLQAKLSERETSSANPSPLNLDTPSPNEEIKNLNQTSISSSEIPRVSPQPISEEISQTTEMPLQAKLSEIETFSANPSPLNLDPPSPQQEIKNLNQTSISSSENLVVSPQPISEEISQTTEMPLQAKLSERETFSANPSPLNLDPPSPQQEEKNLNQTSIYSSENLIVSPQPISKEISQTTEMPLQAKLSERETFSANPSPLNLDTPSPQQEIKNLNQTSISSSENLVVSPQPISKEISQTTEMPLQAKLSDRETSPANPSPLNLDPPSPKQEIKNLNQISSASSENLVVSPQPISANPSPLNLDPPSPNEEIKNFNQTSISSSENLVVSPQPISEEISQTPEMPLQAKLSERETSSANPSPLNLDPPSPNEEIKNFNQTSSSSSENLVVSPQPISEEISQTPEMPLQAKLSDRETSSANPSPLNLDPPSQKEERKNFNQTSSASAEIPIISPQPISKEISQTPEMPLQAKLSERETSSANPSPLNLDPPSPNEEIKNLNQTSISSSEIPRVSPQPISEEISQTPEMPLQAKLSDRETSSANSYPLNLDTPSPNEEIKNLNQTSSSSSEIPIISPQPISEEISQTTAMPLQAKLSDRETSSANPSPLNLDTPSPQQEIKNLNQTSSSSSENLVVSPQPIFQKLPKNEELSLRREKKLRSISEQPLLIIQAKQKNNDYSENISSIKSSQKLAQISATNFPIVNAQSLTSKVNFTENKIFLAKKIPNYQDDYLKISTNISQGEIKKNNPKKNINSLPLVSVKSPSNSTLKSQSSNLILAKNTSSNSITNQDDLLNQNKKTSNVDAYSSPRIVSNSSLPTETTVSTMTNKTNSKIDIERIASQIERKLMRRLVIENERRGKFKWR